MQTTRISFALVAVLLAAPALAQADEGVSYLIGLRGVPANPLLRQAHNLQPGHGLLIRDVMMSGPAANAGLRTGDVVLSADGKAIGTTEMLQAAVQQAGERDRTIELEVVTINGDKKTAVVKPMDRRQVSPLQLAAGEGETAQKLMELLRNLDVEDLEDFDLGDLGKLADEFQFRVPSKNGKPGQRDPLTFEGRVRLGELLQGLLHPQPTIDQARVEQLELRIQKLEATVAELTQQLKGAGGNKASSSQDDGVKSQPRKKPRGKKKPKGADESPSDNNAA